jgi:hypothetical protein
MSTFAKLTANAGTWKKGVVMLGGAAALAIGVMSIPTAASASDCYSCVMWQDQLTQSANPAANQAPRGSDLAVPMAGPGLTANAGDTHCRNVNELPSRYSQDEVSSCKATMQP